MMRRARPGTARGALRHRRGREPCRRNGGRGSGARARGRLDARRRARGGDRHRREPDRADEEGRRLDRLAPRLGARRRQVRRRARRRRGDRGGRARRQRRRRRLPGRGARVRRQHGLRRAIATGVLPRGPRRAGPGAGTCGRAARPRSGDRRHRPRRAYFRRAGGPRRHRADGGPPRRARRRRRVHPPRRARPDGVDGAVGTVGQVDVEPGAANVIPGRVRVSVDVRAPDRVRLDSLDSVRSSSTRTSGSSRSRWRTALAAFRDEIERRGLPVVELPSGAGHDAAVLAAAGVPTAMLFVRSLNGGVSHSPEEESPPPRTSPWPWTSSPPP